MASKKISALPDGGALQDADEFPATRGIGNVHITGANLKAHADSAVAAEAAARAAADALLVPLSQKGVANGVATLGADGLIPAAQIGGSIAALAQRLSALKFTDAFASVMSSPPTTGFVSPGGSSPVTSPRTVPWGSKLLSVYGGLLSAVSGHPEFGDNQVNNGWTAPLYYIEFDYYSSQAAPVVAVRFRNSTTNGAWCWAWVDGQPVTASAENMTASASNSAAFYSLTFAAAGKHRIRFYLRGMGLGGIDMAATDFISPVQQPMPKVAIFGDSYIDSAPGATSTPQGLAASIGRLLGAEVCSVGQGGTGWANNGGGTSGKAVYSDAGRVAGLASLNPDLVVVYGSSNDDSSTQATVAANAASFFAQVQQALPRTPIIVIGPNYTGTPPSGRLATRDTVKAACAAASNVLGFIDPLDPRGVYATTPAWATGTVYAVNDLVTNGGVVWSCRTANTAGSTFSGDASKWQPTTWICGTGKVGSTAGDGNADVLISSDGVHPSQAGHDACALSWSQAISNLLRAKALKNLVASA